MTLNVVGRKKYLATEFLILTNLLKTHRKSIRTVWFNIKSNKAWVKYIKLPVSSRPELESIA